MEKATSRAKTTAYTPSTLTQEAVAPSFNSHSAIRQEQLLGHCATLLRDEVFNDTLDTVNTQHGTTSWANNSKSGRTTIEDEVFDSCHLPQIPDMPMAGSSH